MHVIKGQQDLKEVVEHWKQTNHIMAKWFPEENIEEKPKISLESFCQARNKYRLQRKQIKKYKDLDL